MLSLERSPEPWLPRQTCLDNPDPSSAAQPVNPACFSGGQFMQVPFRTSVKCPHSTPQRFTNPSLFRPFLAPQKTPEFWADKPITRCPNGWRRGRFGTHLGATGGDPKHTRAEQE
jgi:hypothetical protein